MKKKIFKIFLLLLLLTSVLKIFIAKKKLSSEHRYTVGIVLEIKNIKQGKSLEFTYIVNNIQYKGVKIGYKFKEELIGQRFFVKYYPKNPNNCYLMLEEHVPDSIQYIPQNGWELPPVSGRSL